MAKKKVYVSFDYEKDKHRKHLLKAWDANPKIPFGFSDKSANEIKSNDISRVKAGLTKKIKQCTTVLVLIGKEANKRHPDSKLIGDKNWINWEINQAKKHNKDLVAVKIEKKNKSPDAIKNSKASWAMKYNPDSITKAMSKNNKPVQKPGHNSRARKVSNKRKSK